MGKKSYRERSGAAPREDRREEIRRRVQIDGCMVEMPKPRTEWKSYKEAIVALKKFGFSHAHFAPAFDSQELTDAISSFCSTAKVYDCTDRIPTGPDVDLAEFPNMVAEMHDCAQKEKDAVYIAMRTKANTPAFLGGVYYNYCATERSPERACRYIERCRSTPYAWICRGRHFAVLPTSIAIGTCIVSACIAAAMGEDRPLPCSVCQDNLIVQMDDGGLTLKEFTAPKCDHIICGKCVPSVVKDNNLHCKVCEETREERFLSAIDQLKRAMIEDAKELRESMKADGIEVPDKLV